MTMSNPPEKGTRDYALADVLSRPNAMNGLYRKLKLSLEWENLNKKNATYITHTADLADKVIQEAIDNQKDLDSQKVQEEIQAAFYGGVTGASLAITHDKFLKFLGLRK
jgi:predicted naringenin-chalcone synthase